MSLLTKKERQRQPGLQPPALVSHLHCKTQVLIQANVNLTQHNLGHNPPKHDLHRYKLYILDRRFDNSVIYATGDVSYKKKKKNKEQ